jgi:hypothetical protein
VSYDVWLEIDTGGGNTAYVFDRNMTSNVAPMWREAGADLAEMDGKPAVDCWPALANACDNMVDNPEKYKAMNPPNGWGSYDTCLDFLRSIRDACQEHPACTVRISR